MILSYIYIRTDELNRREVRERQSTAARDLLWAVLESVGVSERDTARDDKGRPYLVGRPDVDFNISHSDNIVVCALSVGEGRVGVDVERSNPTVDEGRLARLADRYFSPDEAVEPSTFISAWTEKEAYLKYIGIGLTTDLKSVHPRADASVKFERLTIDDYSVAVCLAKDSSLESVRRFTREGGSPAEEG